MKTPPDLQKTVQVTLLSQLLFSFVSVIVIGNVISAVSRCPRVMTGAHSR